MIVILHPGVAPPDVEAFASIVMDDFTSLRPALAACAGLDCGDWQFLLGEAGKRSRAI